MRLNSISNLIRICLLFILSSTTALAEKYEDDKYSYNYSALNGHCQPYDPYETINRKIFIFNSILDTFLLRPVAKAYQRFTNDYTKNRVETFIENINVPLTAANYTLQGNSENTLQSVWRFAINSTFGVAGLFDIASKFELNPEPQNFGNTLANYGVGPGPYIIIPFYGGMGARDITNPLFTNNALNIAKYPMHRDFKYGLFGAGLIHYRAKILPFTDYVTKNSPDPYIAIRDAILNQREAKMVYPSGFKCPVVN